MQIEEAKVVYFQLSKLNPCRSLQRGNLTGKPYTGNPSVRFDEGTEPFNSLLLYFYATNILAVDNSLKVLKPVEARRNLVASTFKDQPDSFQH